jgi:hypothetical protein
MTKFSITENSRFTAKSNSACKLGAWFALVLLLAPTSSLGAAPVTDLKVLSFNIWVQGGSSLSNCIEVIRTTGADIVGLQECNQATAQIIATNLSFYVLPAADCPIVSRYPILSSPINTTRGVGATIQLSPGQRVHLFNCHLVPFPYGPYDLKNGQSVSYVTNQENSVRMPELRQLLNVMQPFVASFEPCFLVGDFNAPSHLDYGNLPWPTSVAPAAAGLGDSYRELHATNRLYPGPFASNEPGITWTPKTSQEPDGVFDRIDFVHYSLGDGVTPTSSIELDERNSINPWPSDHRAVLTTFTLTPPTPLDKASLPAPANLATNIPLNPHLIWLPGSNATNHAVYFGTSSPGILTTNTTNNFVALGNLLPAMTYFWRINESTSTGVVTGDVWSFTTKSVTSKSYEWNFANSNLAPALGNGVLAYADGATTSNLTVFGTTDGTTIPHIGGKPAKYLRAPAFTGIGNGYTATFTDSPPNGGGAYINQYTMIFDMLLPAPINWFPFFNTSLSNASGNDADFYVAPDGSLGIFAIGYSAVGIIAANTWYRVTFAADLAAGTVTYYLNGTPVFSGSAAIDGRHAIYSNADSGHDLVLFNEGDTSGAYTHVVYLSSFFFTDRTMSALEIAVLGGPKARGILVPAPSITLSVSLQPSNVLLNWSGGEGPFQVQKTFALTNNAVWQNVGAPTSNTNATTARDSSGAFFRVLGQWP